MTEYAEGTRLNCRAWKRELGRYRAYGSTSLYVGACQAVKRDEFIAIDRKKPAKMLAESNRASVGSITVMVC